jgi:hypothetical protein
MAGHNQLRTAATLRAPRLTWVRGFRLDAQTRRHAATKPCSPRCERPALTVVLSVPKPLRLRLARDPAWSTWVGSLIVRAIGAWQRRGARARGIPAPRTGTITLSSHHRGGIWFGTRGVRPGQLRAQTAPRAGPRCRSGHHGEPPLLEPSPPANSHRGRFPWADLLRRVFARTFWPAHATVVAPSRRSW